MRPLDGAAGERRAPGDHRNAGNGDFAARGAVRRGKSPLISWGAALGPTPREAGMEKGGPPWRQRPERKWATPGSTPPKSLHLAIG